MCYDKAPPCPSGSQLPKREPLAPPFPSPPATVTEHISEARNTRHGGGGEARLRLLFRGCQVPHPPLLPLPPLSCWSPQRQQTKAPQPPTRRSLLPPAAVLSGIQTPSLGPHSPQFSPIPRRKGQHGHLWRSWTGCSIPGPALRQRPEGRLWWGGPGQGLRDGVLPLGAAKHTAAREGGHREIGKRGPERVRHDPAAATWWQVRQWRRQRGERARGAEAEAAAGRGGRGKGGPCHCRPPGGGAAVHQRARPRPRAPLAPQPGLEKGPPALRIFPQGSPAAFPGQRQILLEGKGAKG